MCQSPSIQNQSIPSKCTAMTVHHVHDEKPHSNAFLAEKQHIVLSELLKAGQTSYLYFKLDSLLDIFVSELFRTWNALQNTEIKS